MVGLVRTAPSGKTTVGTVWFPPLWAATLAAACGSCSMSISSKGIPSRLSWPFNLTQYPHQGVVYMIRAPSFTLVSMALHPPPVNSRLRRCEGMGALELWMLHVSVGRA